MSGNALTEHIPDDWRDMSEEDQDEFLSDHEWVAFEGWSANDVMSHINGMADDAIQLIESNL